MMIETYEIVLIVGGLVCFLAILHVVAAARHDQVVAAAPKQTEIADLLARIRALQDKKTDLEEELRQRREAIKNMAEIGAEVDLLSQKLAELDAEWNQKDERREEVRRLWIETEEARESRQTAKSKLEDKKIELKALKDQVGQQAKACKDLQDGFDRLDNQIKTSREIKERLQTEIDELELKADQLEETKQKIFKLEEQDRHLSSKINEMDIQIAAKSVELERLDSKLKKRRDEHSEGSGPVDPLAELRDLPPVLVALEQLEERERFSEKQALETFSRRLKDMGLQYPKRVQLAFHTSMKTNESTQMTVLAGISGTGKSQLPRQYAAAMGMGFLHVPVQPRWDSPQDLMGFYNYIEKRFRPTDMARALYQMDAHNNCNSKFGDRMLLILLDEMNLARVEYYFSEFLSRLESRPPYGLIDGQGSKDQVDVEIVSLRNDAEIELEIPITGDQSAPRIFPGYNVLFAGTMNEDESTQSLSDKVVDRAEIMRFSAPRQIVRDTYEDNHPESAGALTFTQWRHWVRPSLDPSDESEVAAGVEKMASIMKEFGRPFGHRLGSAIVEYVRNYPDVEGSDRVKDALADQVEMRLLPKLRGVEVENVGHAFEELEHYVGEQLDDNSLCEAINQARQDSENGTGQFAWTGVTRGE